MDNSLEKFTISGTRGEKTKSIYFDNQTHKVFLQASELQAMMALYDGPKAVVDDDGSIFLDIAWFKAEYPTMDWGDTERHIKGKISELQTH